jgi:predicted phosphodiesterase
MKIVIISDTHTKHEQLTIPECDVLVHCGDFSWTGDFYEVRDFRWWFADQPAKHKIVIAGNHEETFDEHHPKYNPHISATLKNAPNIHYLEEESLTIDGVKFYGTPWTPWFHDWGFNGITDVDLPFKRGASLSERYSHIPKDVQVLICHGPPYDILDMSEMGDERTGSIEMRKLTSEKLTDLRLYLCGHIHEARGIEIADGNVTFINASSLDRDYKTIRPPIVVHLDDNGWVNSVEGVEL